ncbi:Actin cross-linking protein [Abeliophyllum distichum]|uniref:Actin cross-linking protein n=1 Tax=Abeliophyllum distichum TaxID=126358 RepID=A0ABD1V481_9LAMI
MEFFNKAKAVRLKSHLDKYLVADDDEETVRQSRNGGASKKARWTVELVEGNPHIIRLKGCHGKYLTAADVPFLLGMTGMKVLQTVPATKKDISVEWEPIKEGYKVKLRTKGGKFLRANGATPPWRNSITHDLPHRTVTQDWVLWEVEVVDISLLDNEYISSCASSFSSEYDYSGSNTRSPSITSENRENSLQFAAPESRWPSIAASQDRWLSITSDRSAHRSGMEFFNKAKAVRLQSHFGKYLVADEDEETVRQSRNGASHKARWTVEFIEGKNSVIRLKSCHGRYLTASDDPFLLGMTGKKVLQTIPATKTNNSIEWEAIKEGNYVKLMTREGKFLRANGGTPPWRNSITHDIPHRTATQNWVLWGVDIVDIFVSDSDSGSSLLSPTSSFSSLADDYMGSPDTGSPAIQSGRSWNASMKQVSGMEFFKKAKSVRLKSHHDKYLTADDDEESVIQDRAGSSINAKWTVEFVEGVDNVVRLKSCYEKYLAASDEQFLLGVTGRKVVQTFPRKLDSSVEWEPIRDGVQIKLKTRYGEYLRANGGLPPWRNSITHDIPHRHHDWILWEVDVIEILPKSPPKVSRSESLEDDVVSSSSFHLMSPAFLSLQSGGSSDDSPRKSEGRLIYYNVADDYSNVNDAIEGPSFQFKGHGLEELTQKLEEETGLENIIVCSRNQVNGKLYPLRLALPPNNATMHVVVVPSTSRVASDFIPETPTFV